MHMTYMRHPPGGCGGSEDLQKYPFSGFFAHGENAHQKEQADEKRDLIAVGNMQTTIWETAWYLRGMENLFCDMMAEEDTAWEFFWIRFWKFHDTGAFPMRKGLT